MNNGRYDCTIDRQRRAGVLLHPSSLPEAPGNGDIGHQAYRFIEFLNASGFRVWQMLPIGPTHADKSPYQCLSSHAGNPLLISLDWLEDKTWLDRASVTIEESNTLYRQECLQQAGASFFALQDKEWLAKFSEFKTRNNYWLDDYALFMALKHRYAGKPWYQWPAAARHRDAALLQQAAQELHAIIEQITFEQFVFFTQWQEVRAYARKHNVELFGDLPIFVAHDSADVWAQRQNFLIDADGKMEFIAGVPPDAFSDNGQRWGNPLFDWEYMQANDFAWWKQRFATQLQLFDMVRIDHFRGLQACWQIPESDPTAVNGRWVEVPGNEMLDSLYQSFHCLPLVAEDLGVITEPVIELKNAFNLPGMKVLQFAFDGNTKNPHLPHRHLPEDLVYTGTHDNNTTLAWAVDEMVYNTVFLHDYIAEPIKTPEQTALALIRLAMSSVSFLCILPMQDVLMLGATARMNTPGTVGGNWEWRFDWQQVSPEMMKKLSHFITLYQR